MGTVLDTLSRSISEGNSIDRRGPIRWLTFALRFFCSASPLQRYPFHCRSPFICASSTSITWERTASRPETGLLIPSGLDSYQMSGLTEKKPPETERHFCALRSRQSGAHRGLVSVPHGVVTRTLPVASLSRGSPSCRNWEQHQEVTTNPASTRK
jgi:hypothetical protein